MDTRFIAPLLVSLLLFVGNQIILFECLHFVVGFVVPLL